jgi:hypothetical protein
MGEESPGGMTIEDLEAMRQEFSIAGRSFAGHGLGTFDVRDDLRQVQLCFDVGVSVEEWARDRGAPLEYARTLRRFLAQD